MATATKDVSLNKKVSQFFWRSWAIQASWNYERQMNMGFLYGMVPTLDRLYPDESDPKQLAAKKEAYHRHMAFYNCTPQTSAFILGLSASMEEEYAKDPENFDPDSINAVKTSLMGPLSGIGDSFFQGTIRVIAFGLGVQLAQQGSIMGPILAMLISIVPSVLITWFAAKMGYQGGHEYLSKLQGGDLMEKLMYVCGIVGLMSVGGMIATLIGATTPLQFAEGTVVIQDILDGMMPQMISLGLTGPHRPYVLAHQEERQHRLASRDRHRGRHRPLRGRHPGLVATKRLTAFPRGPAWHPIPQAGFHPQMCQRDSPFVASSTGRRLGPNYGNPACVRQCGAAKNRKECVRCTRSTLTSLSRSSLTSCPTTRSTASPSSAAALPCPTFTPPSTSWPTTRTS